MRNVAARAWSAMMRRLAASSSARAGLLFELRFADALAGQLFGALDQRRKQIRLEVRELALQHGGDALEAHAGVDRGLGQGRELVAGRLAQRIDHGRAVELHEDEVPDLDVAGVVLAERQIDAGRLRSFDAHVVEDLGAGAAGPGLAHLPEIVLQRRTGKCAPWGRRLRSSTARPRRRAAHRRSPSKIVT